MDVYVGMDVHRKHSQVAIVDAAGAPTAQPQPGQRPGQADPDPWRPRAGHPVAFEAAYGWGWLVDLLQALEPGAHLGPPTRCKAIAPARLKNDKVDAAMAQLLRADLLPEAWIARQQVRDLRALLRH